jgi:hypothetical protein
MQPRHTPMLQNLLAQLQDALDRDRQFIERAEQLRRNWKAIAHQMEERLRRVLEADTLPGSETHLLSKSEDSG